MKKVFVSVLLALSFCLPFVTSVTFAADLGFSVVENNNDYNNDVAIQNDGEVLENGLGDFFKDASKVADFVGYLQDIVSVIRDVKTAFTTSNPAERMQAVKDAINTIANDVVQYFVPWFPEVNFADLISNWTLGWFDSIRQQYGNDVADYCELTMSEWIWFDENVVGEYYLTYDEFANALYNSDNPSAAVDAVFTTVSSGSSSFFTGVFAPVCDFCVNNAVVLAFLSVTFLVLGVRITRSVVRSFGRGR